MNILRQPSQIGNVLLPGDKPLFTKIIWSFYEILWISNDELILGG